MYRHFALVTIALTAGLAMFADGENREAIAARIDAHQQEAELRRASQAQVAAPHFEQTPSPAIRGFDDESELIDLRFGRPMLRPAGRVAVRGSGIIPVDLARDAAQAGYSEEYLASLSEQERELLLKGLRENGLLSPAQRSRTTDALIAASHRRSGGTMTAD